MMTRQLNAVDATSAQDDWTDGQISDRDETRSRRPRIAIMGEFSAGKSTLANLLLGEAALPTRVTATQLPPVWLTHGQGPSERVDLDGLSTLISLDESTQIPIEETQYLRVKHPADVLEMCDILDFPGISDPNMSPEVWQRVVPLADSVLWCTHATQAWRQSEAAVWEDMPLALHANSFLLVTRIDRVSNPQDRARLLARLRRETHGQFADVFPVSLTQAMAAGSDRTQWEASGAEALTRALIDKILRLSDGLKDPGGHSNRAPTTGASARTNGAAPERNRAARAAFPGPPAPEPDPAPAVARIVPRRVTLDASRSRRQRPAASDKVVMLPE